VLENTCQAGLCQASVWATLTTPGMSVCPVWRHTWSMRLHGACTSPVLERAQPCEAAPVPTRMRKECAGTARGPAAARRAPAGRGILRGREFERLRWEGGPLRAALADVLRVHEWAYVRALQQARPAASAHRGADPPSAQQAVRAPCADALRTSRAARRPVFTTRAGDALLLSRGPVRRVSGQAGARRARQACGALADGAAAVGHLDGDTAISAGTFGAALAAAGAVCRAVDRVVAGEVRALRAAARPGDARQ